MSLSKGFNTNLNLLLILETFMALALEGLSQRFRGCLVGGLLGDCLGAPFEGESRPAVAILNKYFQKLEDPGFKGLFKY